MKKNLILIGGIVVLLVGSDRDGQPAGKRNARCWTSCGGAQCIRTHAHARACEQCASTMPAFLKDSAERVSLGPTLAPEKFTGLTRDAYRAVREIPVTIAQMPCYCHCDRGFGHKSLYSCFEDDHASHCAVCVNEALMAHKLEKEEKLTAPQIRDRIVDQFGHLAN